MTEETLQKLLRLPLTKESRKSVHEAIERIRRRRVMTTYIKDLPDEKLIELCAEVNGWYVDTDEITGFDYYCDDGCPVTLVSNYNPLATTLQGKAQTMELVESFGMFVGKKLSGSWAAGYWECADKDQVADNLQRAIVLAVVTSKYGDTIEDDGGEE